MFTCLDDPVTGPRLRQSGITEDKLIRYILARAQGIDAADALFTLMDGDPDRQDAQFVSSIVEQFPIPIQNR
jgi:hypothetical protein